MAKTIALYMFILKLLLFYIPILNRNYLQVADNSDRQSNEVFVCSRRQAKFSKNLT